MKLWQVALVLWLAAFPAAAQDVVHVTFRTVPAVPAQIQVMRDDWSALGDANQAVSIPCDERFPRRGHGYELRALYPGYQPTAFKLEGDELLKEGNALPPVRLTPEPGPAAALKDLWLCSPGTCLVALVLLGISTLVGVWLWMQRPRWEKEKMMTRRIAAAVERAPGDDDVPPMLGKVVRGQAGRAYTILSVIGQGGMGVVFEAAPSDDPDETWAVKLMHGSVRRDPEFQARFEREIAVCSKLNHPGIVKILDWGKYLRPGKSGMQDWPFMVMERVTGKELRARMKAEPKQDWRQALGWTQEILKALEAAHQCGVIHRDLKPENVMITDKNHAKLMDFGVARQTSGADLTRTDSAMGTPYYMSAEHLDAKTVTPASDVYSVGVMLYEMLAGRPPYEGEEAFRVIMSSLHDEAPALTKFRTDLPDGLIAVIAKMMARSAQERYSTAEDARQALARLL